MTRLLRIKMAVAGVLGTECKGCGALGYWPSLFIDGQGTEPLQVGHPKGRRWSIRRTSHYSRWLRYLREALAGKVQAECGPCNRKHGGSLRYKKKDRTRQGAKRARRGTKSNPWPIRQTAPTCWCGDVDCRDHT
jgi:hypothetical protein